MNLPIPGLTPVQRTGYPNLESLYNNPAYSDIVLSFDDNKIRAHKAVLIGVSTVFRDAFGSSFAVSTAPEYNIEGHSSDIVHAFIKHAYGLEYDDNVNDNDRPLEDTLDFYINLFLMANEYNVESLGSSIADRLKTIMSHRYSDEKSIHHVVTAVGRIASLYATSSIADKSLMQKTISFCVDQLRSRWSAINFAKNLEQTEPFSGGLLRCLAESGVFAY